MSTEPQTDASVLEQTRRRINRIVEEIARLSESQLSPPEYFGELLKGILTAIAAPAGAVWTKTTQGHLQIQYHIGMQEIGLDQIENGRESHFELLRQHAQHGQPRFYAPHSGQATEQGRPAAANLTGYVLLIAPILVEKQVAGLIEVWQGADRSPNAQRGFLQFMSRMADFASAYLRNTQLRQMVGQQTLWTQLEAYSREIHASLNPREVAYKIVNEGRRLIDCDRVSAAVRQGSATTVEAISGADVIQKRSSLVQCMRSLFDEVIKWGDKLVYTGTKDETLPPKVMEALDTYLAESNSKLLILQPLRDEREKESKRPCRSALMMECFEPPSGVDTLASRMEVICRHATPALYNSVEYRRIPFRWVWHPLARIKDGLRGNRAAIAGAIAAGVVLFILAMVFVPYPLRMDADGKLLPKERQYVFPKVEGTITQLLVEHGQLVRQGQPILRIRDFNLQTKMDEARNRRDAALERAKLFEAQISALGVSATDKFSAQIEAAKARYEAARAGSELETYMEKARNPREADVTAPIPGEVVTFDLHEQLVGRAVKPDFPLMRIAQRDGNWEYELRIPETNVGHIREALAKEERLKVELALTSDPDRKVYGWLYRDGLAGQAEVDPRSQETVLVARVRNASVEEGGLSRKDLDTMQVDAAVRSKIHCGRRAIGYVWFYELWEFFYEHVLF